MKRDFEFHGTERFEVLSRLGSGGMGVVYEVFDHQTNTRAALKTLRAANPESLLRFKDEFRAIQNITHPNLVQLRELVEDHGQWYFTMELVDGVNFIRYVRSDDAGAVQASSTASAATDIARAVAVQRMWERGEAPPTNFDELRLRIALPQLVSGVIALHKINKIHRDIKPSNVMVTREGRVVLLDFGFIFDVVSEGHTTDGIVVGTADYMAPEQAAGKSIGPAADWYALGVVLYRSLTGQLPYSGSRLEVLTLKQQLDPPAPRELDPEVPGDLSRICMDLLQIDTYRRANGSQVLVQLGADAGAAADAANRVISSDETPFVGRGAELGELEDTFREILRGRSVTTYLTGESGVGKSVLVQRFIDTAVAREPNSVALVGRCHERESVPYKAVDGIVDELSLFMRRLTSSEAAALLPVNIGLVAQVFPTLRRVEAVAQAPPPMQEVLDPLESRRRMFEAVRELLARLAERRPLVVAIDDLQWADADSMALLKEIMQPPEAPPLLLIASARTDTGADAEHAWERTPRLFPRDDPTDSRHMHVEGLPVNEARELAVLLLDGRPGAEAIAGEAHGHPLFIDELVRHSRTLGEGNLQLPDLEVVLWERICLLSAEALQILEVVALAGAPFDQQIAATAADLEYGVYSEQVARLGEEKLVRTTGTGRTDQIEPYHGRVRDAVVEHFAPERQKVCHHRLALGLEAAGGADLEALSVHWHGAGDRERAGHYAAEAAARAASALAFERAARLYRQAIEWRPTAGAFGRRLRTRLGDALANAGRGLEAAQAYLDAAEGSSAAAELELKRMAADQLLRSGHIDEGLDVLGAVLEVTGMSLGFSERRALLAMRVGRGRLRVRGLGFKQRDASQVSLEELTQIDIAWTVSAGLANVDFIRGAAYQTRHLLLTLDAGEPYRVCRALIAEAMYESADGVGARRRTAKLLERAEQIAGSLDNDHARGLSLLAAGHAGVYLGDWRKALECCEAAEEILRDRCTNVWWERNSAQVVSHWALAMLGELGELGDRVRRRLREAEERGDQYAATNLRSGLPNLIWLAAGDVQAARAEADEALRRWSKQGFHLQHYHDLLAQAQIDLYEGNASAAHRRIAERWNDLERSMLLRVQIIRVLMLHLRARVSLAVAERGTPSAVKEAARDARRLADECEWAVPLARMVEAGVAAIMGKRSAVVAALRDAVHRLDSQEMGLLAAVARRQLGLALGGSEGGPLVEQAEQWMTGRKVTDAAAMAAVLAPGFAR